MDHKETYKDAPLAPVDDAVGIEVGVAVPYSLFQGTYSSTILSILDLI